MNKINFFKPTINKIVFGILLFILLVPFIYYDTGIRCIQAPCNSANMGSIIGYLFFSYQLNILDNGIHYDYAIIGAIISYIVACIIVLYIKKI